MHQRREAIRLAAAGLLAAAAPATAQTEGARWPDRPVRIVVPYAAGGGNDILARLYGQKLAELLGQPFVIDNRPGGGGVIGADAVIRARPDGYTLLVHPSGPVLSERGAEKPAYDRQVDLAPIAVLGTYPAVVYVPASSPHRSLAELIAWAKANPDKGTYGVGGTGFQLGGAYFAQRAGIGIESIMYRSSNDAITALGNGEGSLAVSDPGPAHAAVEGGRVRPLAVTSARRLEAYPEVPTMAEAGLPDFELTYWIGLFGPAGMPAELVRRLWTAVRDISRAPDVRQRLALHSVEPDEQDPEAFRRTVGANDVLWRDIARRAGISLER